MKKLINGNKVLVISHEDDIDGLGGVILGYLAFKDVDYMLIHIKEQTEIVDFVKNSNYEKVFITDLGLDELEPYHVKKAVIMADDIRIKSGGFHLFSYI